MVNFSPLAAEIGPVVWGIPANFNRFRVLAELVHGTLVVGVSQTLRRWTEGATSAGRPSRLALVHILVRNLFCVWFHNCVCILNPVVGLLRPVIRGWLETQSWLYLELISACSHGQASFSCLKTLTAFVYFVFLTLSKWVSKRYLLGQYR